MLTYTKIKKISVICLFLVVTAVLISAFSVGKTNWTTDQIGTKLFNFDPGIEFNREILNSLNLIIFLHLVETCLLGNVLGYRFLKSQKLNLNIYFQIGISFILGYLIFGASARIITYIFPSKIAFLSLGYGIHALSILIIIIKGKSLTKSQLKIVFSNSIIILLAFLAILVIGLQIRGNFIISDATLRTIRILDFIQKNSWSKIPLVGYHYDEYAYFLTFNSSSLNRENILNTFWLMYAAGKTASLFTIFGITLELSKNKYFSAQLTFFLFFTFLNSNPLNINNLFDAGSPMILSGHIGRLIIDVIAILSIYLFFQPQEYSKDPPVALMLILGIGISTISISVLISLTLCLIAGLNLGRKIQTEEIRYLLTLIILSLVIFVPIRHTLAGILFVIILFFAATYLMRHYKYDDLIESFKKKPFVVYFAVGLTLGYIFLGNFLAAPLRSVFNLSTDDIWQINFKLVLKPFGAIPNNYSEFPYPIHQLSYMDFLLKFGLPLVLVATLILFTHYFAQDFELSIGIVWTVMFYGFTFLLWDFFNSGAKSGDDLLSIWTKSRFTEPVFYALIYVSFISFFRLFESKPNVHLKDSSFVTNFLFIWNLIFVVGFINSGYPMQLLNNIRYLVSY